MIESRKQFTERLCGCFCAVLLLVLLWRWREVFFLGCAGYVFADMPQHIDFAEIGYNYSLLSSCIRVLLNLLGRHYTEIALSFLMAGSMFLNILFLWHLMCSMFRQIHRNYVLLAVLLAFICGPWIVPGYQTGVYTLSFNGNMLHNTTVVFSRIFIPTSFYFCFRIWDRRHERINMADWCWLLVFFTLSTAFKPNFAFAFIPMVGIYLIYDFIRYKAKYLKNEIMIGLAVVPAGLICLWQYYVLFTGNEFGADASIVMNKLLLAEMIGLVVMYLRGLLLPAYTVLLQARREDAETRSHMAIVLCCMIISIVEAIAFAEGGTRANHGNFDWGAISLSQIVFAMGILLLFRMIQTGDMKKNKDRIKVFVGALLLFVHLVVGVYCLQQPGNTAYFWIIF